MSNKNHPQAVTCGWKLFQCMHDNLIDLWQVIQVFGVCIFQILND